MSVALLAHGEIVPKRAWNHDKFVAFQLAVEGFAIGQQRIQAPDVNICKRRSRVDKMQETAGDTDDRMVDLLQLG